MGIMSKDLEQELKALGERHDRLYTRVCHLTECFDVLLKHLGLQFRYIPPANERYELEPIVPKEKV